MYTVCVVIKKWNLISYSPGSSMRMLFIPRTFNFDQFTLNCIIFLVISEAGSAMPITMAFCMLCFRINDHLNCLCQEIRICSCKQVTHYFPCETSNFRYDAEWPTVRPNLPFPKMEVTKNFQHEIWENVKISVRKDLYLSYRTIIKPDL